MTITRRNCTADVECVACGKPFKRASSRDKWCPQCRPAEHQRQRNKQKAIARHKRGAKPRLHEAHIKAYHANLIALEKEAAKIGPPHPRSVSPAVYQRWRIRINPAALLNMRLRVQIRKALKGSKAGRAWESMVGYTVNDLKNHLHRQLPKGATLNDLFGGKLHIDHIIPKSAFDITKPDELRACWALSNLRPLAVRENMRKGAKRTLLL